LIASAEEISVIVGQIDLAQRAAALALFHKLAAESFTVLPVQSGHFRAAAMMQPHQ
jgi:hypothetical protein